MYLGLMPQKYTIFQILRILRNVFYVIFRKCAKKSKAAKPDRLAKTFFALEIR